jgi:hypothetical protein
LIRGGVYRETVTPARSGATGAPIVFQAYQGEVVTISGNEVISGWTLYSGHIYRAAMPWSLRVRTPEQITDNQLFVDGGMMVEARWPNLAPERVTRQTNSDKARSDGVGSVGQYAATYLDSALGALPAGLFNGGEITFAPGTNILHTTCDVVSQSSNTISLQCNPDVAAWNARSDLFAHNGIVRPQGGNYYYLWGKLAALDAPGEWFRDSSGNLYLWTPDGSNPSTHLIEAKRRLWAFDLSDRQYIVLDGLRLFAASVKYNSNTANTTLQNVLVEYPWHFHELPVLFYDNGTAALRVLGSDNVIRDSTLAYSAGIMISLGGTNNRVVNNVVFHAGYMGVGAAITGVDAGGVPNPGGAASNQVIQNTIFEVGRLAIAADPGLNITYNDLYESHLQISDLGTVYSFDTDGRGATIAYNLVHDNRAEHDQNLKYWGGFGIFLDDNTRNYKIYRNVVWNTTASGIFVFGTQASSSNRLIYHNTVDGRMGAQAKDGQTLDGTAVRNNIANETALSGAGLVASDNYIGDARFVNREEHNYQLRHYSPAVDIGVNLGSPYTDAPMQPVGAPDLGALERGRAPFKAGALARPRDLPRLIVRCLANANGTTALCRISNLPLGRQLPDDFEIAIGDTTRPARTCTVKMDYTLHYGEVLCLDVPSSGLSGVQPVYVRGGGSAWVRARGEADLQGMAVLKVTPNNGLTTGGTRVVLNGRRFDVALAGWRTPLTLHNASGSDLFDYQVLVRIDTAHLIAQGKMRPDCADVGFFDEYGELDFWLEDGCDSANTRFWVKVPYVPKDVSTLTFAYGYGGQTRTSDGRSAFVFFDDFEDGAISRYWTAGEDSFYIVQEKDGQMTVFGTTTSGNMYDPAFFYLNTWLIPLPRDFAIDSELSVIRGPNTFKANLGTVCSVLAIQGVPSGSPPGKNIAYYIGSSWMIVGKSKVDRATFSRHKFSVAFSGPEANRTVRWMENGNFGDVLATRSNLNNPDRGLFIYAADAVSSFEARFDNVRVRRYVYPEPTANLGAEQASGMRITFGGVPCANTEVVDPSTARCTTSAHPEGVVDVVAINPSGQSAMLANGYTYIKGWSVFLPIISRR